MSVRGCGFVCVCTSFFLFHAGEDMQENIGMKRRRAEGSINGEKVCVREKKRESSHICNAEEKFQILPSLLPCKQKETDRKLKNQQQRILSGTELLFCKGRINDGMHGRR